MCPKDGYVCSSAALSFNGWEMDEVFKYGGMSKFFHYNGILIVLILSNSIISLHMEVDDLWQERGSIYRQLDEKEIRIVDG